MGGGGLIRKWALIIFFSQDGGLLERVGLFKEGQLNREDAAFLSINSNIYSIYLVLSEKAFSTYLFCFLVYRLNLLLFRVTLSVHLKVCKVHLKITTVVDVIEYDILKQI